MPVALEHPDGSWSWMVLLASLITQALTASFPICVGVFFTDLQRDFQATNSETSWFPSILGSMLHAGGLGMSLSFQSSITVLGLYFIRRRPLANALASTGISLGVTLWPPFARYLLENLSWRGSFLIFGGVLLHCCVCGAIIRPIATSVPKTKEDPLHPSKTPAQSCPGAWGSAVRHHLAFDILQHNVGYRIYTLGVMWMFMGYLLPPIFLVPYAIKYGVDEYQAALLISSIGFCSTFLRPVVALVTGRPYFASYRKYLFTLAVLLNGLSNLVCTVSANFWVLAGFCLLYSASMSGIGIFIFQVLMEIVPMDRFPSALGFFSIIIGISSLISPPLAGFVLDRTGNFSYVFCMSSFFLSSAGLFVAGGFYYLKKKEQQGRQPKAEGATPEASLTQGPAAQGQDSPKEQPLLEMVTSV
ncbi:monocarboxylate transporter 6 isoform X2 [Cavia porcellus]|uniref:monocarboxylate transporter 6 isoform X2 n=1 Tax=Cavia porcellus TaxID=10141 RepID=UPI002FDFE64A